MEELKAKAENGDAKAQFDLGVCYQKGRGVPRDYVQAHKWFSLSSAQGNENAKRNVSLVQKGMTTEQIAEARRLAREFKPRKSPEAGTSPFGQPPKP